MKFEIFLSLLQWLLSFAKRITLVPYRTVWPVSLVTQFADRISSECMGRIIAVRLGRSSVRQTKKDLVRIKRTNLFEGKGTERQRRISSRPYSRRISTGDCSPAARASFIDGFISNFHDTDDDANVGVAYYHPFANTRKRSFPFETNFSVSRSRCDLLSKLSREYLKRDTLATEMDTESSG